MASVDASIASQVASAPTSRKAWDSLHTSFANKSHTRIFSLRDMLGKVSKEAKTIAEYLREIKSIADELTTAGAPISNEELIVKILSGLGTEYREISAAIRARDSPIMYEELYVKLIDDEVFLKHEDLKKGSTNSITAAISQRTNLPNHSSYSDKRRPPSNQWRQNPQYPRPPQNLSGNSQPQWRSSIGPNTQLQPRLQCQLCEKYGHSAQVCRSRSHNHMEAKANFAATSTSFNST